MKANDESSIIQNCLLLVLKRKKRKDKEKKKMKLLMTKKEKKNNNGESFKNLALLISLSSLANPLKTWLGLTSLLNASACANQVI